MCTCQQFHQIIYRHSQLAHTPGTCTAFGRVLVHLRIIDTSVCSYVFSRQRRDERLARGADQRSAVIVSQHPYTSVLQPVAAYAGAALLADFHATAQQLLQESATQWPAVLPGRRMRIDIGFQTLVATIPADACLPEAPKRCEEAHTSQVATRLTLADLRRAAAGSKGTDRSTSGSASIAGEPGEASARHIAGIFNDVDVARPFQGQLASLWPLWEITLLGKPLLVFAATPRECSDAVAALLALLTPLPYMPDFRPVLSVHDPLVEQVVVCIRALTSFAHVYCLLQVPFLLPQCPLRPRVYVRSCWIAVNTNLSKAHENQEPRQHFHCAPRQQACV